MNDDTDKIVSLRDGRPCGVAFYGDPLGVPTLYCHGTPSCRLGGLAFDSAARACGLRLICIDRPGIGKSAFFQRDTIIEWTDDVADVLRKLEIKRFGVIGYSGGGPYALACAAVFPERLRFTLTIGSFARPSDQPLYIEKYSSFDRFARWIMMNWYGCLAGYIWAIGFLFRRHPGLAFRIMAWTAGHPDRTVLKDDSIRRLLRLCVCEAYATGAVGVANDASMLFADWGFDLRTIEMKVTLIHGEEDRFSPIDCSESLASALPNATLIRVKRAGHFLPPAAVESILRTLLADRAGEHADSARSQRFLDSSELA